MQRGVRVYVSKAMCVVARKAGVLFEKGSRNLRYVRFNAALVIW